MKKVHQQQKHYHRERNWYNQVMEHQKRYKINNSEKEILEMGRYEWKKIVKGRIMTEITDAMNHQRMTQTKSSHLPPYTKLEIQEYFTFLSTEDARLLFRIRAQVFDFKLWQKYRYDDLMCRLCGSDVEDVYHVLNDCTSLPRSPENIVDVYSLQIDKIEDILKHKTFSSRG